MYLDEIGSLMFSMVYWLLRPLTVNMDAEVSNCMEIAVWWKNLHKTYISHPVNHLYRPVVFNLIGGTEPFELHQCIHRTLRNWTNKIWFLWNIGIYFISAQNEPCISCTQNHCVQRTKFHKMMFKIVLEFLTSVELLRMTQRTPGVRSNPG